MIQACVDLKDEHDKLDNHLPAIQSQLRHTPFIPDGRVIDPSIVWAAVARNASETLLEDSEIAYADFLVIRDLFEMLSVRQMELHQASHLRELFCEKGTDSE